MADYIARRSLYLPEKAPYDWINWLRFFLAGISQVADDATRTVCGLCARISQVRQQLLAKPSATGCIVTNLT
ncbi:MAG: hypothetical protein ABI822_27355 [Bryobacteraceae bacterium]